MEKWGGITREETDRQAERERETKRMGEKWDGEERERGDRQAGRERDKKRGRESEDGERLKDRGRWG